MNRLIKNSEQTGSHNITTTDSTYRFAYDEYADYGPDEFTEVYNGEAYGK